jgi:hypothetical protein
MTTILSNILSADDLTYLLQCSEVLEAKTKLASTSRVYFTFTLTDTVRSALQTRLGLDLSRMSSIPMRWIQGDSAPHVDAGSSAFENTYLIYLNDSPGEFVVDNTAYPITTNTAFVFKEGIQHKTQHTGTSPRLLLGPMNEFAQPVGFVINYYLTESDALTYTNALGGGNSYVVGSGGPFGPGGGYTYWRLASNSNGSSPQNVGYPNGSTLIGDGSYFLYPSAPCFLEGTQILCEMNGKSSYISIEDITPGTLVKTSLNGSKPVKLISKGTIQNPGTSERTQNRLYKCSPANYPELTNDLYITGCHSILVDELTDTQRKATTDQIGRVFVTDKKYRLMACIDERAEPWASEGTYTIWHLALDNADERMNYGIYVNGGLLVETCSINFLKRYSNLQGITLHGQDA